MNWLKKLFGFKPKEKKEAPQDFRQDFHIELATPIRRRPSTKQELRERFSQPEPPKSNSVDPFLDPLNPLNPSNPFSILQGSTNSTD